MTTGSWKSEKLERRKAVMTFAVLTFASLVMAVNYRTFVAWGGLYPAGATGLSMLVQRILQKTVDLNGWGWTVPFSPINFALNAAPVWIGFRFIGRTGAEKNWRPGVTAAYFMAGGDLLSVSDLRRV